MPDANDLHKAVPPPDAWDEVIAKNLPGCLILVGLTWENPDGSIEVRRQLFGYCLEADRERGIRLRLEGAELGKNYWLPPDTRALRRAPAGEYRLKTTGEIVKDPDYTCNWTIERPKH